MKFDLSKIVMSKNDERLNIKLPQYLNSDLAYLMGVQIGDGCLRNPRQRKSQYMISYDGHSINDRYWQAVVLKPLIKKLFNKDVKIRFTTKGTVNIKFHSKAIFTFLTKVCVISESPKRNIRIPDYIFSSSEAVKRSLLRGLADTDFSLTFKPRTKTTNYPVIFFQTYSQSLHVDTKNLLQALGFRVRGNYRKSSRYGKVHDSYYIQISGRDQLNKWLKEVGFYSFNHITRYELWKKLGSFPSGLNINERLEMLKEEGTNKGPYTPPARLELATDHSSSSERRFAVSASK
jgi:hypothetical protein